MSANDNPTPAENTGDSEAQVQASGSEELLPFSAFWPMLIGALAGVLLRILFSGRPGSTLSAMSGAFILLAPFAVGAITVYAAERTKRRGWGYYFGAAAFANFLFVVGTMLILIEGIICAIIIVPLFCLLGVGGGLMMGVICRATNWPRHAVHVFLLLPIILGVLPRPSLEEIYIGQNERTIIVSAPPEKLWQVLNDVRDIKPQEVGHAWLYRIGVPLPQTGVTTHGPDGIVRRVTMGKSIYFDQLAETWEPNRQVRWKYRFYDDSVPPKALDDHVKIGGHYFDMLDTEYTLRPIDAATTELKIKMRYRVSTEFNWYAKRVAGLLVGNFETVILEFYRNRAMQQG